MNQSAPYITSAGTDARVWERDAGGALGEIQLALKDFLEGVKRERVLLVAALSGGPDSLALAAAMSRVAIAREDPWQVAAFTVDHGWRAESAAEAEAAAACAREFGFEVAKVLRAQIPEATGGPERAAREMRWRLLARASVSEAKARGLDSAVILTGHTLDDQAETVLLRLGRGASLQAVGAMGKVGSLNPKTGLPLRNLPLEEDLDELYEDEIGLEVGRPLLGVRRVTTHAACEETGLVAVVDPTNKADGPARRADGEALPRAAIRERVLPELARALGQDPAPALARFARQAQDDEMALHGEANKILWKALVDEPDWEPGDPIKLEISAFEMVHETIVSRVILRALTWAGARSGDLTEAHLREVTRLIRAWHGQGPLDLPGIQVSRQDGFLVFERPCP
ncbi:MAG: tRNA lysidine(34) synthetase TilS [Mobiluncus porci]|uniref:tRNA(Ile)-lysidine synthase n=2 Tax=Mobiluncus TaxID=2050 RepID=A0A7K0K3C4_9ACTO|nr:tRNA lysidine(34) synthetase TilS [Mobiluncus porci]MDD7541961.1 tRNA lysidine(34) synthetase TilS [Mobiluncus porci]MDY5747583.1 tRNA lysidine(34) synthetase TilS [Mobiluncus porci]MST49929.1 tRNA lysidine(34) synthetase TilS [Mobiluncus porci]